jgi:hypothetical protein
VAVDRLIALALPWLAVAAWVALLLLVGSLPGRLPF